MQDEALVIAKLDRLSRDVAFIAGLMRSACRRHDQAHAVASLRIAVSLGIPFTRAHCACQLPGKEVRRTEMLNAWLDVIVTGTAFLRSLVRALWGDDLM